MRRILILFGLITTVSLAGGGLLAPSSALAASPRDQVCQGIGAVDGSGRCQSGNSLNRVVRRAINIFSVIIGIVAVIMIMVSGYKYITAGGDSGNIGSAKNTLIYAIVGLVVVALSQFIVRFVMDQLS